MRSMRRVVLFAAVGALLAIFLASCSGSGADQAPSSGEVRVGQLAPDFTLPSADGTKVRLSDFKGKPVLLYFSMGPG